MDIGGQLSLWDLMSQEIPEQDVPVKGAINLKSRPISDFKVTMTTGDLVLIVSMIEDYIRGLDVIRADDIQWTVYYRERFRKISDHIQTGIQYNYEKAREQCLKKQNRKEDDIGEEAMALTVKRAMKEAERKAQEQQAQDQKEENG